MIITFHGEDCFKIQTTKTVITNSRLKADIFVKTAPDKDSDKAEHYIIGPGEYEIKEAEIRGFANYIYYISADGISIGYLSKEAVQIDKEIAFNAEITEKLMDVDILLAPGSSQVAKTIRQLHPKIVIVTDGNTKRLEKELGIKTERLDKLSVKKKDLAHENKEVRLISLN